MIVLLRFSIGSGGKGKGPEVQVFVQFLILNRHFMPLVYYPSSSWGYGLLSYWYLDTPMLRIYSTSSFFVQDSLVMDFLGFPILVQPIVGHEPVDTYLGLALNYRSIVFDAYGWCLFNWGMEGKDY